MESIPAEKRAVAGDVVSNRYTVYEWGPAGLQENVTNIHFFSEERFFGCK